MNLGMSEDMSMDKSLGSVNMGMSKIFMKLGMSRNMGMNERLGSISVVSFLTKKGLSN